MIGSKSEERLLKKQTENMSHELEVKASTPMQRKDISVNIDRTLLTNKQKDIFVFNKLANKLGVGTVISMDVAKKKPREIMKIILRTWEQNKEFTTTAEELLAALNYSTEGMKQDIFQTLKPILRKLIEDNMKPRTNSKNENALVLTNSSKKHNKQKKVNSALVRYILSTEANLKNLIEDYKRP